MDEERTTVGIGELAVLQGSGTLAIYGLGSCVAVVLYDPGARVGGMAHVLLPGPRPSSDGRTDLPAKYADEAYQALCLELESKGGTRRRWRAGIIGGARLFSSETPLETGVGARNIEGALKAIAASSGGELVWNETGGVTGRSVLFHLPEGRLLVRTLGEGWREASLARVGQL